MFRSLRQKIMESDSNVGLSDLEEGREGKEDLNMSWEEELKD